MLCPRFSVLRSIIYDLEAASNNYQVVLAFQREWNIIIFVYGTLLKGLERESVLTNSGYMGPAMIQAELFDLGYYPGTKEGKGRKTGARAGRDSSATVSSCVGV